MVHMYSCGSGDRGGGPSLGLRGWGLLSTSPPRPLPFLGAGALSAGCPHGPLAPSRLWELLPPPLCLLPWLGREPGGTCSFLATGWAVKAATSAVGSRRPQELCLVLLGRPCCAWKGQSDAALGHPTPLPPPLPQLLWSPGGKPSVLAAEGLEVGFCQAAFSSGEAASIAGDRAGQDRLSRAEREQLPQTLFLTGHSTLAPLRGPKPF